MQEIEGALNEILSLPIIEAAVAAALAAAAAANTAADNAQEAADDAAAATAAQRTENSLVNSGVIDITTPPLISADSAGSITISNHKRKYGDPTLNPTVSVTGGVLATAFVAGDNVYVYYDDASRAGGAVTYQTSLNSANAVQGGNRHSVGAVTIPGAGTDDGTYVPPPGVIPLN